MNLIRASTLVLLAVGGLIVSATLAAAVAPAPDTAAVEVNQNDATQLEDEQQNSSLGAQISAFMQSNAAQTNGAVNNGMWVATFKNASGDEQVTLVNARSDELRTELEELRTEKQELIEARENDEITQLEYESQMSTLIGRYVSLTEAIDTTVPLANDAGVETEELETLRNDAHEMPGPEVAEVAQNVGNANADAPGLNKSDEETDGLPAPDTPGENNPGNGVDNPLNKTDKANKPNGGHGGIPDDILNRTFRNQAGTFNDISEL